MNINYDKQGFPINVGDGIDKGTVRISDNISYDTDTKFVMIEDAGGNMFYLNPATASSLIYTFYLSGQEELSDDIMNFLISVEIIPIIN